MIAGAINEADIASYNLDLIVGSTTQTVTNIPKTSSSVTSCCDMRYSFSYSSDAFVTGFVTGAQVMIVPVMITHGALSAGTTFTLVDVTTTTTTAALPGGSSDLARRSEVVATSAAIMVVLAALRAF